MQFAMSRGHKVSGDMLMFSSQVRVRHVIQKLINVEANAFLGCRSGN